MFGKLLLLFILVPIAELAIFLALGDRLGLVNTLIIIVLTAIIGAALTKSQGAKALHNFQKASTSGKLPAKELTDGLLILIAGAVLLTPGFLTDTIGFLLLIPPARAAIRKVFSAYLAKRITVSMNGVDLPPNPTAPSDPPRVKGKVIDV
ncbi:MAG: FxsA family protein [Verrucomicrobiota bacterium]